MKFIHLLILFFVFLQNLYAKNPIQSPTFDDILKEIIKTDAYIFDDENIKIKVPSFADNPVQVPVFADAKNIKNAKRIILFADLNPTAKIIDMDLTNILPLVSLNIKVAQETPLRALVLDENNVWHIGSKNIKSFGGGCSVASVTSSNTDFEKLLGKIKTEFFKVEENIYRIKSSIFHPMETGLIFGNSEFYINKLELKDDENILSSMELFSSISENPRFIFETKVKSENYNIKFYDTDGNLFTSKIK